MFMKCTFAAAIAALSVMLTGCTGLPLGGTSVTATGDPARDLPAVQAAVDRGGTVVLSGNFDFGDRGRVSIRRDVEIVGRPGATIRGGFWPLHSPLPVVLPAATPGPKIAIRNLHFDGALWSAINIGHASGLEITGNRISGVRPHPLALPGIAEGQVQAGIFYGVGWAKSDMDTRRYLPGVFTGYVVIRDNVVEMQEGDPSRTLGYGVFGQWTTGVHATIEGNTIRNTTRTGIEAIDHYRGSDGHGSIRIAGNHVTAAEQGIPFPSPLTANALLVGYFSDRSAALDPTRYVDIEVTGNLLETWAPSSFGIGVLSNGAHVIDNTITVHGAKALGANIPASEVEFRGNRVAGQGAAAVAVNPLTVMTASRNRLVDNDFSGFQPAQSHVVFGKGSEDNACSGRQFIIKISDEGLRNRCP